MRSQFDRRVLSDDAISFIRQVQHLAPCHLGGGAALSGAWLSHRLSRDIDLFFKERVHLRELLPELTEVGKAAGCAVVLVRDGGAHVRATVRFETAELALDLVHDPLIDVGSETPEIEGIRLLPYSDLRASKLTCLLSRAEPRDLVDALFLERDGFPPEQDFGGALRKDAGMDPSTLAWLIREIPTAPMPIMLEPLSEEQLVTYRDALASRFKQIALGAI